MFRTDGLDIWISRGDSAELPIDIEGAEDGDQIAMTVKKSLYDSDTVFVKYEEIDEGQVVFEIEPEDTMDLDFGTYYWDLRVFPQDGGPITPFKPKLFRVLEVVGNNPRQTNQGGAP